MPEVALRHRFPGFALDVAFRSPGAGVTALFGPSGCGKSTILAAVAGLLRPEAGRVAVGGAVLLDTARGIALPPERRRCGVVFQDARLFPHLSVAANLRYGLRRAPRGAPGDTEGPGFDEVVDLLGLASMLGRRPLRLSGGERQRVALGRALLARPRLLLMDEPLAALDAGRRAEVLPFLARLRDAAGLPILYVTHALDEVDALADRLVLLEAGQVLAEGTVEALAARADLPALARRRDAGALIPCTVLEQDTARGLTRLGFDGGALVVAQRPGLAVGARLRLRLRARDVAVALETPRGISMHTSSRHARGHRRGWRGGGAAAADDRPDAGAGAGDAGQRRPARPGAGHGALRPGEVDRLRPCGGGVSGGWRLAPVDEARALLPGAPVAPRRLPLDRAIGHVLAELVRAAAPVPPCAVAAREGWALEAAATEGAGGYAPVLLPGLPWLRPGDAMPPGTDAVLPAVARDGAMVLEAVAPGEGVRPAGEDAVAGTVLRPAGHLLGPLDLVLVAAGVAELAVRLPRVALDGPRWLVGLIQAEGATLVEDAPDLVLAPPEAADQLLCPAIAARPGDGLAIGLVGGVPALLLPPDLPAALAGWWLLGRPVIRAMAGRGPVAPRRMTLARKVASPLGLTELVMLGAAGEPVTALGAAAAVLVVPPGREGYEAGAVVEVEAV